MINEFAAAEPVVMDTVCADVLVTFARVIEDGTANGTVKKAEISATMIKSMSIATNRMPTLRTSGAGADVACGGISAIGCSFIVCFTSRYQKVQQKVKHFPFNQLRNRRAAKESFSQFYARQYVSNDREER